MEYALIDAGYEVNEDQVKMKLFVKDEKGEDHVIEDTSFTPYFHYKGPKIENERVVKIEGDKVFVKTPQDVAKIKDEFRKKGVIHEYDIPYVERYLIDHKITPMTYVDWETKKPVNKELKLKTICFDLETYNANGFSNAKKDPIIMISFFNGKQGFVYTTKKIKQDFVKVFKNEKEMIEEFLKKANEYDIIISYNGDNFDLPYIKERIEKLSIENTLGEGISVRKGMRGTKSKIKGKIHLDAYRGMSFLSAIGVLNLPKYNLESVYEHFTGKTKVDIDCKYLYDRWDNEKNLEEVALYSYQDAEAAYELGMYMLPVYTEISKLIGQLFFNVSRFTSSQMVESLLLKMNFERGEISPNKPIEGELKKRMLSPIKGAFVRNPESGLHENLVVLDFKGLYPSIIISHNIDPSTISTKGHEAPTGTFFSEEKKGLIPEMLERVVKARSEAKALMKKAEGKEKERLNAKQWALKIIANATYGYMLYARARWYSRECGEAITAWARHYIQDAMKQAEDLDFKIIYGDSLTNERFVTIKDEKGIVRIKNIEELFEENKEKIVLRGDKQIISLNSWKALTINPKTKKVEWKKINEIIRHKTKKQIFRVNQKHGETRVTEDHSLIVNRNQEFFEVPPQKLGREEVAHIRTIPNLKKIKKIDLFEELKEYTFTTKYKGRAKTSKVQADENYVWFGWTKRKERILLKRHIKVGSKEFEALCRLLGAYIAEGSSSTPETSCRMGASIANSNKKFLVRAKKDYNKLFKNAKVSIIQSAKKTREIKTPKKIIKYGDQTQKLQMMSKISAVFFKQLCGQKSSGKKLPEFIFHTPKKYQNLLLNKMVEGDGSKVFSNKYSRKYVKNNFVYTTKSLQLISGLTFLLSQQKQEFSIQYRPSKKVYTLKTASKNNKSNLTKVNKEDYSGYVYDLSVDGTHMFVDSCGQLLLHNTDSLFIKREKHSKEDVKKFVNDYNASIPEAMELELEGFYPRGIFVTKKEGGAAKKRYALLNENGQIEIKGLEFVRRDWSKLAKKLQEKVIRLVLEDKVEEAKKIVKETISDLKEGKIPLDDLVIYTQIKRRLNKYDSIGPHVRAAMRLEESGEKVGPGTLIGFIVTQGPGNIGDKSYPEQLIGNRKPDVEYYTNHQILPAVMKILVELGVSEDELSTGSKQVGLGAWT